MAVGIQLGARYELIGGPREASRLRTNYANNPSFELNTTPWSITGGSGVQTLTRATNDGYGAAQPSSGQVNGNYAAAGAIDLNYAYGSAVANGMPVSPGQIAFGRMAAKVVSLSAGTATDIHGYMRWWNSGGALVSNSFFTGRANPTIGTWYELTGAFIAPASAAYATITIGVSGSTAAAVVFRVDQALLIGVNSISDSPDYFDGDTPGYYWIGTPHASMSAQDGTRAVLNDDTDPDFVGNVNGDGGITGLDSAEIREVADDNINEDGAIHGEFYQGRRPITVSAQVGGNTTPAVRNARGQRLLAAARALRVAGVSHRPGVIRWAPSGYPEMFARYRAQQPARESGQWVKEIALSLVAADPRIYAVAPQHLEMSPAGSATAGRTYDRSYDVNYDWAPQRAVALPVNSGDGDAPVVLTFYGPMDTMAAQNVTTGEEVSINGSLSSSDVLVVDTKAKTAILNGTTNAFDRVQLDRTRWWGLAPGANDVRLLANTFSGSAKLAVDWRDAWA